MTDLDIYKQFQSNTPNARLLSEQVLCLPMYSSLSFGECERIIDIVKGV